MSDAMADDRDRRHRSPRYQERDRRDSHRDDRYRRDDRRDDRRPREYRDRDDGRDRRRYDEEDRGGYRRGGGGGGGGGGGRGGGGDSYRDSRDDRGRREHKERGGSPERRSPTPPGAVPLSQRRRKASGWDVTAPGYEQYSAMQAKQTGLFNLPGANRSHGPQIIGFGAHPPVAGGLTSNTNLARQSRRLYLGSITPMADEDNIALFFNSQMRERNLTSGSGQPVLAVQVNREKNYAFVEFRSAEDATAGMQLDGTVFLDGPLRVRRPHDYAGPEAMSGFATLLPSTMPDSIHKIFIGNLPVHLSEDQIVELLKSFGELKAFNLVREHTTGQSKGFAFVEYNDPAVTDIATEGLNGMDLGDKKLVVQRASIGAKGMSTFPDLPAGVTQEIPAPIVAVDLNKERVGRILLMLNMVTPDDLVNDEEYEEILDDIRGECSEFGEIEDVRVPRPVKKDKSKWGSNDPGGLNAADAAKMDEAAGVGRVYVKFADSDAAAAALRSLAGRSFAGRMIVATLIADDANVTPPLSIIFN
ncbi:hypothetical protein M408DRAFT_333111 [Serendipita vermifera MAFF 305830]|uniref:Splicing factor U2AF subunit n=1 Tax=Serendipita vermifera MAFF 305830 TaxID=933852 RepID=A0A0C3ABG3_SERVB|nr:hypothetical protein M408DRAFT_333111 [Serendipita vermifera MAFF 305830]